MEALAPYYLVLKAAHVGLAMLSGAFFAGRGLGVLLGARMPMARPVRLASVAIDSTLLLSALLLLATLGGHPLSQPWLHAKLTLLVAYIVLGSLALRRARGQGARLAAWLGALVCFAAMVSIALTRDPAGMLRPLLG